MILKGSIIEMKVGLFPGFSLLTLNKSQTPVFWSLMGIMKRHGPMKIRFKFKCSNNISVQSTLISFHVELHI